MIGQTLNQYIIEQQLAVTSTGTVYLAKHILLQVPRAIKIIHPQLASKDTVRNRVKIALEAWAKLDNPQFIYIFDAIDTGNSIGFAMDYIPGNSLRDILQSQGKLGISQAIDYFLQILKAVSYAHQHGMLHRKLAPENIKIGRDETIKIMGLGALRHKETPKVTPPNLCVGKVKYMAPEQFQGKYSIQSDQYALGIILYEMVTGQVPFQGKTLADIYKAHISDAPIHPQKLNAEVTEGLQAIILKMIAKKPQDRFPNLQIVIDVINEATDRIDFSHDTSLSSLMSQGRRALERRHFEQAIYFFNKILSIYGYSASESQEALTKRKLAYTLLEEETDIRKMRDLNIMALGNFDEEKFDEARRYVREMLELMRKYPESSRVRGIKLDLIHEMPDIVHEVQTELEANWNKSKFSLENAQKLLEELQYQEALYLLAEAVNFDPHNEVAEQLQRRTKKKLQAIQIAEIYCAGRLAMKNQRPQEAVMLFEKVLQISTQHVATKKYLRIVQNIIDEQKKRRLTTEQFYKESRELYEQGTYQEAINRLQQVLTLDQNHTEAKTMMMQLQERVDDDQILEKIGLFYNKGLDFYRQRRWKEAITCFNSVLNIMSTHKNALQYKKAAEDALQQEESFQQNLSMAVRLFQNNRYSEALAQFNVLAQQEPRNPELSRYRRLCLEFMSEHGEV